MTMPGLSFWQGKRVLVTGHSGFKGRWLLTYLSMLGSRVHGVAKDKSTALPSGAAETICDVRDKENIRELVSTFSPEIIFHLAAVSTVPDGLSDPVATFATNVVGTANVLQAAREAGSVRATVVVTSDKSYKNQEWLWGYRETDALGGIDPYSASKAACEFVVDSFRESFMPAARYTDHKAALATARCGNLIGGGDLTESRLIPSLAQKAKNGEMVGLRNQFAVRPWLYVLDALRGYILLAEALYSQGPQYNGAWNFGPAQNEIRAVREMAGLFLKYWGSGDMKAEEAQASVESGRLWLDSTKSRELLHWTPHLNFEQLVRSTVDFYKRQLNNEPLTGLMQEFISVYLDIKNTESL